MPIRLIRDRWIGKYTEQPVAALADLKREPEAGMPTTETGAEKTVQVHRVYICVPAAPSAASPAT